MRVRAKYYGDVYLRTLDNLHLAEKIGAFNDLMAADHELGLGLYNTNIIKMADLLEVSRMIIWKHQVQKVATSDPKKYGPMLESRLKVKPKNTHGIG